MSTQLPTLQTPESPLMFIDIEAGRDQAYIWLISVLVEGKPDTLRLFYAETPDSEEDILNDFLSYYKEFGDCAICHYGGFDERLMIRQMETYGLDYGCLGEWFDMHLAIKRSGMLSDEPSSLKDVASRFGYEYGHPRMSGSSVPLEYVRAVRRRDEAAAKRLREYGKDDVRAMQHVLSYMEDDMAVRLDRSWMVPEREIPPSFERQCTLVKSLNVDGISMNGIALRLGVSRQYVRARLRANPEEWKGRDVSFEVKFAIRTGILPEGAESRCSFEECSKDGIARGVVVEQVSKNAFRVRANGAVFQVHKDCLNGTCDALQVSGRSLPY